MRTRYSIHARWVLIFILAASRAGLCGAETLTTISESPAEPPDTRQSQTPARSTESMFQELDRLIQALKDQVEKKKYERMSDEAVEIRSVIHQLVEHAARVRPDLRGDMDGIHDHVKAFAEMLGQEAEKGNALTVRHCYWKLTQLVDGAKNIYNRPNPEIAEKPAAKPASSKDKDTSPVEVKDTPPVKPVSNKKK